MSLLDKRPENFRRAFPESKVLVVNGRDIIRSTMDPESPWVAMACNTRHETSIHGLVQASMELDAPVIYEIALSESDMKGGYTGLTPQGYIEAVVRINEELGNVGDKAVPFAVHRDHTTVKTLARTAFDAADEIIRKSIGYGYTFFSIDCSFLPIEQNIAFSSLLGRQVVDAGLAFESEVGEIGGKEGNSTVTEAVFLVEELHRLKVTPDLIAINNGTAHGNVRGQIDLALSKRTFDAMGPWNVGIAQHGTTGTSIEEVGDFYKSGIFKANVGTNWQNLCWGIATDETGVAKTKGDSYEKDPEHGISQELWQEMEKHAREQGWKGGNMKKLNMPFREKVILEHRENAKVRERLDRATRESAMRYFRALHADGKGEKVRRLLS
jgi:fructose/tagatose bisphosphate aldolase